MGENNFSKPRAEENKEADFLAKLEEMEKRGKDSAARLARLRNLRHGAAINAGSSTFFVH